MISLMYKMYRSASQLILARSNLRLGFRSILLFTLTITVDTPAQVVRSEGVPATSVRIVDEQEGLMLGASIRKDVNEG